MAKPPIYVPILKGKEGEYAALQQLYPDVKDGILPLIEVPAVPRDYAKGGLAKELDEHVAPVAGRISKCWGSADFYLDMSKVGSSTELKDGRSALERVLNECEQLGVGAIPVLSLTSSSKEVIVAASHSGSSGRGVCIRLGIKDFHEDVDLDHEASRILDVLRSDGKTVADLVVDLEELDPSRATLIARSVLSMVPMKNEWRRMILTAASFPEDLSEVFAASTSELPRHEWDLWKSLQRKPNALPRLDLIFGDYAIAHPVVKELDPRTMRMSASIRYTTDDGWLVVKGRNVRQYGFEQYFELSEQLVSLPQYSGREYSWGDEYIDACALRMAGPGNATTWRKVGVNHHLTLVARRLATLNSAA